MKLEELNKIYSGKVAEMLNAGWVIQSELVTNCDASIVFRRGDDYRVVYMDTQACDKNYQYNSAVRIGTGTLTDITGFIYIEDCQDVTEHTYIRIGRTRNWFVTPKEMPAIIEKRQQRYNRQRGAGMFREFLGGKFMAEIPTPEARRAAYKMVRKVKGYGNTTLNSILRAWFESGTDGNWHFEPTLCIQVAGKPVEARIPMPCAR